MNAKKFSEAMSELNDKYIEEAILYHAKAAASTHVRRRIHIVLIAAAVSLFLLGCTVVAAVYGDSIQNWFGYQWKALTGQPMSDGQIAVIDHLSQEIGASQTANDVTVTVDSATVGNGTFWLLLRVEGLRLSSKHNYAFDEVEMEIVPNPLEEGGGLGGYGFQYQGLDGDGAALILMDYNYASMDGYIKDTHPLEITLTLKDFVRNANTDRQKTLAEGKWRYVFSLDRTQLPDAVSLPDTETMIMDYNRREEVIIMIRNIVLTNTGIRFQFDECEGTFVISGQLSAVMKNGSEVGNNGGFGTPLEGSTMMDYSFQWQFPIDLDEAAFIQIGSTQIPLP